jgi:hypothetical protein
MPSALAYPYVELPLETALLAVDVQLLPFVTGAVARLQERKYWQSDADYYRASEAISQFLECSMTACVGDLLASNDRLYRLLDSGLNGTIYTAAGDPVVVTPAIPDVPPVLAELPGLIARMDHLEIMLDALPGIVAPGWFGIGGEKATLADVVKALRIGTTGQATEAIDSFQEILGAAGDLGTVTGLVTDLFMDSVEVVGEGGMLLLLAGGIVGTMAALQGLSMQITTLIAVDRRIIQSLDGGAIVGPDDNVLMALRGISDASESRNVIDAIVAALETITTDNPDVLAKLEEIRVLLA